jgi:TolB-like protein/class 3 adenylate cyclase
MSSGTSSEVKLEIGHVLFIDIVGYSQLLITQQSEQLETLRRIIRGTAQFRAAEAEGKLLRLPTGDGGALVFRTTPEAPVLCALEISKELKSHPELSVRMGIHSGPVNAIMDLNEQANIAGAGINIAQRVMDCGDAGHILLSRHVAEDLEHFPRWQPYLHELGECGVKHGARVHVFNLYTKDLGNPEMPEKLRLAKAETASAGADASARREEGFWVAVLPFKYAGANADLSALAEGLSEDIVTGLSRFSYLRVIARSSTASFARDSGDVRTIGRKLGARYVMEGSVRQAGSILRITVQLADTTSGAHLWAESYDRVFEPEKVFTLVDDVAPRIVSTVADMHGVLLHTMSEVLRGKKPESLTPYEAVLRSFGYIAHISVEEHAEVRTCLELAVERAPANADVLAMLSNVYAEEYKQGFNVLPESLERALHAARLSVDAAPSSSLSYHMLAQALFFRREVDAFRNAAERAIALNPMDAYNVAFIGILLAYTGEWERGCALARRAMELNPNHPGWYRFAEFMDVYRKKDYRGALEVAVRFNMPSYYYTQAVLAAAAGQLGDRDTARRALREFLAQKPDFAASAREDFAKWLSHGELLKDVLDGLRKAGLEVPPEKFTRPNEGS